MPKIIGTCIMGNMKLKVEINNLSTCRVGKDFFIRTIEESLAQSGYDFLRAKPASPAGRNVLVSVALVTPEEIRKLNKKYRQMNAVTDVLSFAEYTSRASLEKAGDKEVFLGELILCYNDIKEYAKLNKKNVQLELATVVSHGLFHLLGFSHGKKMFSLQDAVAKKVVQSFGKQF